MQTNKVDVGHVSYLEWTLTKFPNRVIHELNIGQGQHQKHAVQLPSLDASCKSMLLIRYMTLIGIGLYT